MINICHYCNERKKLIDNKYCSERCKLKGEKKEKDMGIYMTGWIDFDLPPALAEILKNVL